MRNSENFLVKGAKLFDLPVDAIAGLPKIEICGNTQVTIENHKGILEYNETLLSLNLGSHILNISGCNLNITAMNDQGLRLSGTISSVSYESV